MGDLGSIPGLGRSSEEGKGYPSPVFWPGEFHGLYSPWSHKESDTTEQLSLFTNLFLVLGSHSNPTFHIFSVSPHFSFSTGSREEVFLSSKAGSVSSCPFCSVARIESESKSPSFVSDSL